MYMFMFPLKNLARKGLITTTATLSSKKFHWLGSNDRVPRQLSSTVVVPLFYKKWFIMTSPGIATLPFYWSLCWMKQRKLSMHQMKTFSVLLAFVQGIHRSPVNSPQKGQWRGVLIFSLICARINGWVNNRDAGDLRRRCAHSDVTVMEMWMLKPVGLKMLFQKNGLPGAWLSWYFSWKILFWKTLVQVRWNIWTICLGC